MHHSIGLVTRIAVVALAAHATSRAATVKVFDPDGHPVPNAAVACTDGTIAGADESGVARVPDDCPRVHCEHGDFAPTDAIVKNREAVCRFPPSVRIDVVLPPACKGERACWTSLAEPGRLAAVASSMGPREWFDATDSVPRVRLAYVPLSSYDLRVERLRDGWTCTTRVTPAASGPLTVQTVWHEPVTVVGTVRDAMGRLREGIPVRAVGTADTIWRCHPQFGHEEAISDSRGHFQLDIDPTTDSGIEAGDPDDLLGVARATLPGGTGIPVELRLSGSPASP